MLLGLPFWFILLPSWLSHVGLFWCHLMSAKALSNFISGANDSRQRPDSRDHLDRTEYLPLLQRSLKFGLKTGLVSFGVFVFEILLYFRLSRGYLSWTFVLLPIWIMVLGGILDGIICKTQQFLRVICWLLLFVSMVLGCMKADYGFQWARWRMVISPILAVLSISSATLIYIVYGHQIGYYRLTEAQLTAGNLYSLAALISIVLMVVVGEVMPLARPVEIETRVFVVLMAPLVVTLVGMGAWVVSRDEFGRLLLYGGQSAVHPRKLRWEKNGWTSVQGRGVTIIPMFGEVRYVTGKEAREFMRYSALQHSASSVSVLWKIRTRTISNCVRVVVAIPTKKTKRKWLNIRTNSTVTPIWSRKLRPTSQIRLLRCNDNNTPQVALEKYRSILAFPLSFLCSLR